VTQRTPKVQDRTVLDHISHIIDPPDIMRTSIALNSIAFALSVAALPLEVSFNHVSNITVPAGMYLADDGSIRPVLARRQDIDSILWMTHPSQQWQLMTRATTTNKLLSMLSSARWRSTLSRRDVISIAAMSSSRLQTVTRRMFKSRMRP
jgi:hypothetical protein